MPDEVFRVVSDHVLDVCDKGHHSGENLVGIAERGVIPLISSPKQKRGEVGFRREDSIYYAEADVLVCPGGAVKETLIAATNAL